MKLQLSALKWQYGRHADTSDPVVRNDQGYVIAEMDCAALPMLSEEEKKALAILIAYTPAILRQALYAC